MRLYRGLKEPCRAEGTLTRIQEALQGTNFTNCPYTALLYADGRRGVVFVVDVPPGALRVTEELWIGPKAKRFMIWGRFDDCILTVIPAKELRAEVRRKGVMRLSDADKGMILSQVIERRLADDGQERA